MNKTSNIEKELDRLMSIYVRLRDSNVSGNIKCPLCGQFKTFYESCNMHYMTRSNHATRWNDYNCNAGCYECNEPNNAQRLRDKYRTYINKKWDADTADHIERLARSVCKKTIYEMGLIKTHLKKQIAKLLREKNFYINILV